ncbi:hypothetical protein ACQKK5_19135 [Brevibacillus panacihumi]|uniref:hypothetical protein n=1 Tax=Brevibacillus panacihumi TaxID=497735 RepID=UPI003D056B9E
MGDDNQQQKVFKPGELGMSLGQAQRAIEEEARKAQDRYFGNVKTTELNQFNQKENGGNDHV